LIDEYYKRISPFAKVEIYTVSDQKEMQGKFPKHCYAIMLEDTGKHMDSKDFAQFIEDRKNQGDSNLVFLIGPPEGFKKDRILPHIRLSLSKMTFSHQTVRLLLAEQLYRAISILEGKPFAK